MVPWPWAADLRTPAGWAGVAALVGASAACVAVGAAVGYTGGTALALLGMAGVPLGLVAAGLWHAHRAGARARALAAAPERRFRAACEAWGLQLSRQAQAARRAGLPGSHLQDLLRDAESALAPAAAVAQEGDGVVVRPAAAREAPGGAWIRRADEALARAGRDAGARAAPHLESLLARRRIEAGAAPDPREEPLPEGDLAAVCEAALRRMPRPAPPPQGS